MGLAILKPSYVPHRGFTECLDAQLGAADLFFGEIGHFQVKCRFEDSDACARFKAELIVELGKSSAGAILPSSKPSVLVANKCTVAVSALVEAFGHLGIEKVSLARHGQKIPKKFALPPLEFLALGRRSHCVSLDVAWNWSVEGGVPVFDAPWAHHPSMWMFAELSAIETFGPDPSRKFGAIQYAVPAKYDMFPGSRITVYPGGYMHHLKGFCGTLAQLGTPKSVGVLRNRVEALKQAAVQMLVLFQQSPDKFSTGRFEVSIARAANVSQAVQFATKIWDEESPRIDMVIIPFKEILGMLERVARMPSIQGENAANVSSIQITDYVRALNSIGFYHWSMKWQLGRAVPPPNLGPGAVVPDLPFSTVGMSYSDICVLYRHIGLLKGGNFTWRTLEKRSASNIGRLSNVVYPISHGSFHTAKLCFEALASWMDHQGIQVTDIAEHVVVPRPSVFGVDRQYPFPQDNNLLPIPRVSPVRLSPSKAPSPRAVQVAVAATVGRLKPRDPISRWRNRKS